MLHAGLDLSRRRLDVCVISDPGELVEEFPAPPDADGLRYLVEKVSHHRAPVRAVIESMTGARFVHDTLEQRGLGGTDCRCPEGQGIGAVGVRDRPDRRSCAGGALASATWCRRSGCPTRGSVLEREQARFRLHLVKHKSMLKHRIHATLMSFGHPCPVSDLCGLAGRELLESFQIPSRGARRSTRVCS